MTQICGMPSFLIKEAWKETWEILSLQDKLVRVTFPSGHQFEDKMVRVTFRLVTNFWSGLDGHGTGPNQVPKGAQCH
jgi:hypothetical protein